MKLKHIVSREISLFMGRPRRLLIPCVLTLCIGIVSWLSCDGIGFVWRITRHPSFTPPLALLFIMWSLVYALFGLVISYSMICGLNSSLCLSAVVSYFTALFWCPIMLSAGAGICAVCTLVLSGVYLFRVMRVICKYSIIISLASVSICVFYVYMIYFSLVTSILN